MGLVDRFRSAAKAFARGETTTSQDKREVLRLGEVAFANAKERLFGDANKAFPKYNPSQLVRRKGLEIYEQMAKDDQIKAALTFKRYAVMASGWEIEMPDSAQAKKSSKAVRGPTRDEKEKEIERQFNEFDGTFEHVIDESLSAIQYGFSVNEKIWREGKKFVELQTLKARHPYGFYFMQDGFGNIAELRQFQNPLPIDKFLIYTHNGKFSNPYGESDLEAAYRAWWIKDNTYKWMAMLLERCGIPPIFLIYNVDRLKNHVPQFEQILQNMQAATTGVLPRTQPDDLELWSPELADNVAKIFIPAIKQFNEDEARALLLPGLLGFTPDGEVGSKARATVQFDVFLLVIERIRKFSATLINRDCVRPICDFNWPEGTFDKGYPEFKWLPLDGDAKVDLFKLWIEMAKGNIVRSGKNDEEHIREVFEFPPDGGEELPLTVAQEQAQQSIDDKAKLSKQGKFSLAPSETRAREAMDAAEKIAMRRARVSMANARDVLLAAVRRRGKVEEAFISTLNLRGMGELQQAFLASMTGACYAGQSAMAYAATGEWREYAITPETAVAYLKQKAIEVAGGIDSDLSHEVKLVLLNSLKNGEPMSDTIEKLSEVFAEYIGEDSDEAKGGRLETIVRTNITDAYNQGRLAQATDPEVSRFMFGVRYSAILDSRTTQCCDYLDGKIFRVDDPELMRLTPPNHFNCRSVLVPITKASAKDQGLTADDYITKSEASKAGDLAGKGFYNITKPTGQWKKYTDAA